MLNSGGKNVPHVERHLWLKKVNLPGYTHLARLTPLQEGYQAFDLDNYICEPLGTPDSVGDAAPVKQHQSLYQQYSALQCSAECCANSNCSLQCCRVQHFTTQVCDSEFAQGCRWERKLIDLSINFHTTFYVIKVVQRAELSAENKVSA